MGCSQANVNTTIRIHVARSRHIITVELSRLLQLGAIWDLRQVEPGRVHSPPGN